MIPKSQYIDIRCAENSTDTFKGCGWFLWTCGFREGGILNEGTNTFFSYTGYYAIFQWSRVFVGAYSRDRSLWLDFSVRGYTRVIKAVKPDLAAPGVDIRTTAAGGGYDTFVPFVTGRSTDDGESGIIKENDPFLYGEKGKVYLRSKAAFRRGIS